MLIYYYKLLKYYKRTDNNNLSFVSYINAIFNLTNIVKFNKYGTYKFENGVKFNKYGDEQSNLICWFLTLAVMKVGFMKRAWDQAPDLVCAAAIGVVGKFKVCTFSQVQLALMDVKAKLVTWKLFTKYTPGPDLLFTEFGILEKIVTKSVPEVRGEWTCTVSNYVQSTFD